MSLWHSYDDLAGRYEKVCGSRFDAAADQLVARLRPAPGSQALDIGSGTGAVLRALDRRSMDLGMLVGCDLSGPMLAEARRQFPGLKPVRSDATHLPFHSGSFDLATASFVLSHVPDYREALREIFRVLRGSSAFGTASWAPAQDPYISAWRELLGSAVEASLIERAIHEAIPWEAHFEHPQRVGAALAEAGFTHVTIENVHIEVTCSMDEFLADRQVGAAARYARVTLGQLSWQDFLARARESLGSRFGTEVSYHRGVILATARRD